MYEFIYIHDGTGRNIRSEFYVDWLSEYNGDCLNTRAPKHYWYVQPFLEDIDGEIGYMAFLEEPDKSSYFNTLQEAKQHCIDEYLKFKKERQHLIMSSRGSGWISVNDELPDFNVLVLALVLISVDDVEYKVMLATRQEVEGKWYIHNVTHWHYLPLMENFDANSTRAISLSLTYDFTLIQNN